jgi:hypothetical protein
VLSDPRDAHRIHFTPDDLLKQRVFQIAAGYEDLKCFLKITAEPPRFS